LCNIRDAIQFPRIFSDVKKGLQASDNRLAAVFGTSDVFEVSKKILEKGEIQVSAKYREARLEEKRRRIVSLIHQNGVDPKSNIPIPITRIEAALTEAKVKIDEDKPAESQVDQVLKEIRVVIPIKFVVKDIEVVIPALHANRAYGVLKSAGKFVRESWENDGSLKAVLEVPGGLETEFYEKIQRATQGTTIAKVLSTR
jgi:ribosome maturation protein SDO1